MEVFFNNHLAVVLTMVAILIIGVIIGRITVKNKETSDGTIFIEPTEDPNRDRVRFVIGMELDDIRKKKQLIFNVTVNTGIVEPNSSQNSQSV